MTVLALVLVVPGIAWPQVDGPQVTFTGEVRVRSEFDDRTAGVDPDAATLLRTRLGALATLSPEASVFVQVSDSRAFGEESNTLTDASADLFDLHQAYLDWTPVEPVRFRAGRQELAFADERLIGPVGWANVTRSFDGLRVTATAGGWTLDGFGVVLEERDQLLATGLDPRANEDAATDRKLFGAWAESEYVELFAIAERDVTEATLLDVDRYTLGAYVHGAVSGWNLHAMGAVQLGDQIFPPDVRQDIQAFMVTGAVQYEFAGPARPSLGVQADLLSGDGAQGDGDYGAFSTLYATNHPFYGYMDFFLSVPQQTGFAGLVDLMLRGAVRPEGWTVRADLHDMHLHRDPGTGEQNIGVEMDLTVIHPVTTGFTIQGGYSVFSPAAGGEIAPVALGDDVVHWAYLQGTMRF